MLRALHTSPSLLWRSEHTCSHASIVHSWHQGCQYTYYIAACGTVLVDNHSSKSALRAWINGSSVSLLRVLTFKVCLAESRLILQFLASLSLQWGCLCSFWLLWMIPCSFSYMSLTGTIHYVDWDQSCEHSGAALQVDAKGKISGLVVQHQDWRSISYFVFIPLFPTTHVSAWLSKSVVGAPLDPPFVAQQKSCLLFFQWGQMLRPRVSHGGVHAFVS